MPDEGDRPAFRLSEFLPFRINRLAERLTRDIMPIYREAYGLGRPEWRVLAHLGACGANSARTLVTLTALDKVQVSRAVAGLEQRGWLERTVDSADRRINTLRLTPAGQEAFNTLMPRMMARQDEVLEPLDDVERVAIETSLAALEKALGIACRHARDPQDRDGDA